VKWHSLHGSILVFVGLWLSRKSCFSQESLRLSLASEAAAAARRAALENQIGNIQIGRASLFAGGGFGLELNDNVSYTDSPRQEDIILHPGASLAGSIPLSEANELYLSLDIGYSKYLRYSQYDRLLIAPGSQLAFDVYIKDFHFNLHDRVSVTESPVAQGTISGTGFYNEFANVAGLSVDWDLNNVVVSAGFDHENAISLSSEFAYLDRRAEAFFARATFQLSQSLTAGPEASVGVTDYSENILNDSFNYSLGLFADWQASEHVHIKPRVGYTFYTFSPVPKLPTPADSGNYFFGVEIKQQLNDSVELSVDAGRQLLLGINSNLIDLWYVRPKAGIKLFEKAGLVTFFTFEQGIDSGNPVFAPNEQYTLLGGGLSTSYQLMEKVLLRLEYDYTVKTSDIPTRSYHQNRILLQVQYTF
jgi:hypothetical protein